MTVAGYLFKRGAAIVLYAIATIVYISWVVVTDKNSADRALAAIVFVSAFALPYYLVAGLLGLEAGQLLRNKRWLLGVCLALVCPAFLLWQLSLS
jgi:hypothetical protein